MKVDIDDGLKAGIVDVARLPPGEYEIYNFHMNARHLHRQQALLMLSFQG